MYLTIKAYSMNAFKEFYSLYANNKFRKNEIIFDEIIVDNVKIIFYNNLTIFFNGILSQKLINSIDILIDKQLYVGSDEVGIGEGVGPIVVCAVKFTNYFAKKKVILSNIKDSKKMNYMDINRASNIIKENSIFKIEVLEPKKFNILYKKIKNIKLINAILHNKVIDEFSKNDIKIIDAFASEKKFNEYLLSQNIIKSMSKEKIILEQKAEEKYYEVAAAAIIAKDYYNEWLINWAQKNKIKLSINKKINAQKLYLDWKNKKIEIKNPNEIIKDW